MTGLHTKWLINYLKKERPEWSIYITKSGILLNSQMVKRKLYNANSKTKEIYTIHKTTKKSLCYLSISKLQDKMVDFLERKLLLHIHQFGFRKHLSTVDPLLLLYCDYHHSSSKMEHLASLPWPKKKSYDTMVRERVLRCFWSPAESSGKCGHSLKKKTVQTEI